MDRELSKYYRRQDKSQWMNLLREVDELSNRLQMVRTAEDLKRYLGPRQTRQLFIYMMITNGTLRQKMNRLRRNACVDNATVYGDIM